MRSKKLLCLLLACLMVFSQLPLSHADASTFYLVGGMNGWTATEGYQFSTGESAGEYVLQNVELFANNELKIVDTSNNKWYPDPGNNYKVEESGRYDVTFWPDGNKGDGWWYGYFKLEKVGEAGQAPDPEYYLVGSMNGWTSGEGWKLSATENEGEYAILGVELDRSKLSDPEDVIGMKIVDSVNNIWYPGGSGNDYAISDSGIYDVYFYPDGGREGCYEGYFSVWMRQILPAADPTPMKVLFADENNMEEVYAYAFCCSTHLSQNADWPGEKLEPVGQNPDGSNVYLIELETQLYDTVILSNGKEGDENWQTVDLPFIDDAAALYADHIVYFCNSDEANAQGRFTAWPETDVDELISYTAPTCTDAGEKVLKSYVTGTEHTVELDALGHNWGDWTHVESSDPSQHARTCSRCNATETADCTFENNTCTVCGFEKAPDPLVPAYYLVGSMNGWTADESWKLVATENEGEYALKNVALSADTTVKVKDETNNVWYPAGNDNDYVIFDAGIYDLYFYPAGGRDGCYEGYYSFWMTDIPAAAEAKPMQVSFVDENNMEEVYVYAFCCSTHLSQNAEWPGVKLEPAGKNAKGYNYYQIELETQLYDTVILSNGKDGELNWQTVDLPYIEDAASLNSDHIVYFCNSNEANAQGRFTAWPNTDVNASARTMKVALIADQGGVEDGGFNQQVHEAAKAWCAANGVEYATYVFDDSYNTEQEGYGVGIVEKAISEGATALLLPGFSFTDPTANTCESHPDVSYILMDVDAWSLLDSMGDPDGDIPANVYLATYREEQAGYLAGFAAVSMGYSKLGFLGGPAFPGITRFGYGFVQGANDAAVLLDREDEVAIRFAYTGQFMPTDEITAFVDGWYKDGVEAVFACGGGIYASAAAAAAANNGKVIGVDADQKAQIEGEFGAGLVITSAIKNMGATAALQLEALKNGTFVGGREENCGVVSAVPGENPVDLASSTVYNDSFTAEAHAALLAKIVSGELTISDDVDERPDTAIDVCYACYPDCDWNEPSYVWAEDHSCTATRVCKNDPAHIETETVIAVGELTKEATVSEAGEMTYTATFTNPAFARQTKIESIPCLGRDVTVYVVDQKKAEALYAWAWTEGGSANAEAYPGVLLTDALNDKDGNPFYRFTLNTVDYSTGLIFNYGKDRAQTANIDWVADAGEAACLVYYLNDNEGSLKTFKGTDVWPASSKVTVAATCTEAGSVTYTGLLTEEKDVTAIAALGHDFGAWTHDEGSDPSTHSRSCSRCPERETEACAFENDICTVCGYTVEADPLPEITIRNGDFESGLDGWTLSGITGEITENTYSSVNKTNVLNLWASNDSAVDVSVSYTVKLEAGEYYFGFDLEGENMTSGLNWAVLSGETALVSGANALVTTGWDNWTGVLTDRFTLNDATEVTFVLRGTEPKAYWGHIDNLKLYGTGALYQEDEQDPNAGIYVPKLAEVGREGFIRGTDVSSYLSVVNSGAKFYDFDGNELTNQGFFDLLAECGFNYIRLRVWNDPYDAQGNGYGGGNCDLEAAKTMGKWATDAGMKVLIDFHYSDFWADPGKQTAPKAWSGYTVEQKAAAITEYTASSLNALIAAGVNVGMVQIGNETNGKFCGESSWDNICTLFSAGANAVRSVDASILVTLHFTNPEKANLQAGYAAQLASHGVDYDVFATSWYPYWHGTTDNLTAVLKNIADTYDKKVMIAETSWAWTLDDGDGWDNTVSRLGNNTGNNYPFSVQGQANELGAAASAILNTGENGLGLFYWENAWIPVQYAYDEAGELDQAILASNQQKWETFGSGWAASFGGSYENDAATWYGGSAVDNQAMFDFHGKALPSLKTFKYMMNGAAQTIVESVEEIETVTLSYECGDTLTLPETVTVQYGVAGKVSETVTWNAAQLAAVDMNTAGTYTVTGIVNVTKVEGEFKTAARITVQNPNLLTNPGFEQSDLSMYTIAGASRTTDDPHTGKYALHFYHANGGTVTLSAQLTLSAGTYSFELYAQGDVKGAEGQQIAVTVGDTVTAEPFTLSGWANWQHPAVTFTVPKQQTVTVSMTLPFGNGGWGTVDDLAVRLIAAGTEPEEDPEIVGQSLTLGGDISVNLYLDPGEADPEEATVTLTWGDGQTRTVLLKDLETVHDDEYGDCYRLTTDLPAKEMTEEVTAVVTVNGEVVQTVKTSVKAYAETILADTTHEKYPEKLWNLARDMLIYGAYTQNFFEYNTDNLAYDLSEVVLVEPEGLSEPSYTADQFADCGLQLYGFSLILRANTALRVYLRVIDPEKFADARVTYLGQELIPSGTSGLISYTVENIAPKDLDKDVTLRFGEQDVAFNAGAYIAKTMAGEDADLAALVKALWAYHLSAAAYFA